jgi:dolichol-phosphate mannosyltransferase
MKKLVIIPTYNEKDNIVNIVPAVLAVDPNIEVLVVDDNSPDGTGQLVQQMMQTESRLHHLHREQKQGLGKAYISGFKWGLDKGFDAICEMDADFSHRPEDLKLLLAEIEQQDFAVGSRYVPGGSTVNWGLIRKIISRGGSLYARIILGYSLNDWTGGFNIWRKNVLQAMNLDTVKSEGYSFQIELKYRALKNNFRGKEVPIVFEDRRIGQSKMSLRIVIEAFYKVWMIRFA